MRCFDCPMKWSCALWFHNVWNVNWKLCDCTDERLIALKDVFEVDKELLKEYRQHIIKTIGGKER